MSGKPREGVTVAGSGRRSRPRPNERRPTSAHTPESLAPAFGTDERLAHVGRALDAIRTDLGFETATLFVRGPDGWELLHRQGAQQPWHGVLDPSVLEGTPDAAEYPDVRSIPGIGSRLARLGCASMAVLPVPDGGRLLLDSGKPCRAGGWIERARPYLELLSSLAGPDWAGRGSLQSEQEVAALDRLFAACQDILARSTASIEDLLEASRRALGADELFLITGTAPTHRIFSSPHRGRAPAAHDLVVDIRSSRGHGLDEGDIRDLAVVLGASSRAIAGALGREGDDQEVLLAGWAEGPALSSVSMAVAARAFCTARAAVDARRQAVSSLLDRERARMAYALHDGLTQTVTGAVLQLDALAKRIEADPAGALTILETAKTEIRRSLAELRGMLFDLSPSLENEQRREEPLTRYVEDVVKRWRLPARVAVEGDLTGIPARVLSVAYVVIREALANAAKHAAGQGVTVTLAAGDNDLMVIVGDGGRGFSREDETAAREAHHVGLDLLRRRVGEVGGHLRIESRPGKGTRVIAKLPMHGVAS